MFATARSAFLIKSKTACTSGSASWEAGRRIIKSPTLARTNSPGIVIARSLADKGVKSVCADVLVVRRLIRTNSSKLNRDQTESSCFWILIAFIAVPGVTEPGFTNSAVAIWIAFLIFV
jgi:hypothetical protein